MTIGGVSLLRVREPIEAILILVRGNPMSTEATIFAGVVIYLVVMLFIGVNGAKGVALEFGADGSSGEDLKRKAES